MKNGSEIQSLIDLLEMDCGGAIIEIHQCNFLVSYLKGVITKRTVKGGKYKPHLYKSW